jgi:hypothetical protein
VDDDKAGMRLYVWLKGLSVSIVVLTSNILDHYCPLGRLISL